MDSLYKQAEKPSSNRKYSVDNSDNRRYSVDKEVDSATLLEATRRAMKALAERYLPEKDRIRYWLRMGIKADVARARREGKEIKRDELPTILSRIATFNATNESNGRGLFDKTLAKLAVEIYYARRCFENDFGAEYEDSRGDTGNRRREVAADAGRNGTEARESEGAFADLKDARPLIIDGEKDDAHKFWKDILEKEIDYSVGLLTKPKGHSIRQGAFSIARSMDELKAEVKEAFPGAKVQESGNKLTFTMPNGQKVTATLHDSLTATDEELFKAKREHGIDQRVTVTVEGYAETVGADGFIALSQGSCEGTGFHEAYHVAEALAFTKKELADAERLISPNAETRADEYAKWKLARKKHANFAKLWQKIADVAAKLAGIFGYETKRNIFRKVESGEIYERDNTARNTNRRYSSMPRARGDDPLALQ